jgi:glycosyltransferase involved in cell wall biosynthesis
LKIVIATGRGFHLRHLARELIRLGRDVTYMTYLPNFRIRHDRIPLECARSYFWRLQPWSGAALLRPISSLVRYGTEAMFTRADEAYARDLPPCDIFIGLSAITVRSAEAARRKYRAKVILERGSRHVLSQKELLAGSGAEPLSPHYIERELAGYEVADYIALPSTHAVESFIERGFDPARLFRNPYGVEFGDFKSLPRPEGRLRLLYVGGWAYRKGCDAIAAMLAANPDFLLTHVGMRGDLEFPNLPNFVTLGHKSHAELGSVYTRHHMLLLPSREDGFGMVLVEALAAELPIIGSSMTGAPDLRDMIAERDAVRIVPPADATALKQAVRETAAWIAAQPPDGRILRQEDRANLSWTAYAKRYDTFLQSIA